MNGESELGKTLSEFMRVCWTEAKPPYGCFSEKNEQRVRVYHTLLRSSLKRHVGTHFKSLKLLYESYGKAKEWESLLESAADLYRSYPKKVENFTELVAQALPKCSRLADAVVLLSKHSLLPKSHRWVTSPASRIFTVELNTPAGDLARAIQNTPEMVREVWEWEDLFEVCAGSHLYVLFLHPSGSRNLVELEPELFRFLQRYLESGVSGPDSKAILELREMGIL